MKRWWIAVVAVLGVALGLLLIPRPDTGKAVSDRGEVKLDGPAFHASADTDPMGAPGAAEPTKAAPPPLRPGVGTPTVPDVNPEYAAAQAAMNTPEAAAARYVSTGWSHIRLALGAHQGDPKAQALIAEVDQMNSDLRDMRRDPAKWSWPDLEKRQNDLLSEIQSSGYGSETRDGVQTVQTRLKQYHDGTIPADTAGPAAQGLGPTGPGPSDNPRVRPR